MRGVGYLRRLWGRLNGVPAAPSPVGMQVPKAELARYLPDDPVIVEAGAHAGYDTLELARQWPRGTVHAFEPVPSLYVQLEQRTRGLSNVRCWRQALSDRVGQQELHLSEGASDGSSSLLEPECHLEVHPNVRFEQKVAVEAVTMDRWLTQYSIPRVDFLWLDLQGMEPAVLRASPQTVSLVRVVHTEVSLLPNYAGTILYPEFRVWMEAQGFAVAREILPYPDMGNVLFVRR